MKIRSQAHAVAIAMEHRSGGALRSAAMCMLDPEAALEELEDGDPLCGLLGADTEPDDEALRAAVAVRGADENGLIEALSLAHERCRSPVQQAWLRIACSHHGLERRTSGERALLWRPDQLCGGLSDWVDLSRSPRKFHLFWALANATDRLEPEELFELAWGRPMLDADDLLALRTTVSRSKGLFADLAVETAGGGYRLTPPVALYTHRTAPRGRCPLSPIGREREAAAVRTRLIEDGRAILTGPPGSGRTELANHVARSWPLAQVAEPRRLSIVVGDECPEGEGPVIWVREHSSDERAIRCAELTTRDAASLAKSCSSAAPGHPTLPLWVRVDPAAIDRLSTPQISVLRCLLGTGGLKAETIATSVSLGLTIVEDAIAALRSVNMIFAEGQGWSAHSGLAELFEPLPSSWTTTGEAPWTPDSPSAALVAAHRRLAQSGSPGSLVDVARLSFLLGSPDPDAEEELACARRLPPLLEARHLLHRAQRSLWAADLFAARSWSRQAGTLFDDLGDPSAAEAWATAAEAALRLGLEAQAYAAWRRSEGIGPDRHRALEAAIALDAGDPGYAGSVLRGAAGPFCSVRAAQLALHLGDRPPDLGPARKWFESHDRRWSSIACILASVHACERHLLSRAERYLVADDSGSRVALALVGAAFDGKLAAARSTLRQPFHTSTDTWTWDIVRTLSIRLHDRAVHSVFIGAHRTPRVP